MRRLLYSLSLIMALMPAAAWAQQPEALSLPESIDYALKNQVKIKNARLDQLSSLAKNKEITGLALPQVKGSAGITYAALIAAFQVPNFTKIAIAGDPRYNIPGLVQNSSLDQVVVKATPDVLEFAFQPKWTTSPLIEASQILFDPSVLVALQAREKVEALAQMSVELTEQQVRYNVTKSYYDILIAEKRKIILDQNITRLTEMRRETQTIYQNGLAEKIDVDRLSVTLNNLTTEQIKVKQLVDVAYMALKFQMGMPLNTPVILSDSLSDDNIMADLLEHSLNPLMRKEFQLLQTQKELNAYDLKRYKLGVLPTLVAFGNYGYTLYNQDKLFAKGDNWQPSSIIGVKLTVPIFDGFQRKSKERQAQFALQKTDNELQNLKLGMELETISARITLQSNIAALENQKANMELANEVYRIASVKYKEGVGSSLEVLNAESSLKEAQVNYFSALYDAVTSKINLQKALGEF